MNIGYQMDSLKAAMGSPRSVRLRLMTSYESYDSYFFIATTFLHLFDVLITQFVESNSYRRVVQNLTLVPYVQKT